MITHRTGRLRLRHWQESDYKPFARMNADLDVMRYFPAPLSEAESNRFAERIRELFDARGWGFWAVEVPDVAQFIGFVGLHIPIVELPFSPCVEIGWRLAKDFWGNGYASEAAGFVLKYGFTTLNLDEIVSFTSRINKPSLAVMSRIGMRFNDEFFDHPSIPEGDPLRGHVLSRLTRKDWQRNHVR